MSVSLPKPWASLRLCVHTLPGLRAMVPASHRRGDTLTPGVRAAVTVGVFPAELSCTISSPPGGVASSAWVPGPNPGRVPGDAPLSPAGICFRFLAPFPSSAIKATGQVGPFAVSCSHGRLGEPILAPDVKAKVFWGFMGCFSVLHKVSPFTLLFILNVDMMSGAAAVILCHEA